MNSESSSPMDRVGRLRETVLRPLDDAFVDRTTIVELFGVSLVSGENLLLIGPPGTAKSALVRELGRRIDGRTFEYLLTPFTEPNEIFGPFDIRRLREGELVTNMEGMLPEADLVFLDEVFRANSAILNSLLGVLNERVLRRGREVVPLPLLTLVGATNALPSRSELSALDDRFLLRATTEEVDEARTPELLEAGWALDSRQEIPPAQVTVEEVRALTRAALHVDLDPIRPPVAEFVGRMRRAGIPFSDRRAVRIQRTIAASAILSGRTTARISDLWVFRHVFTTRDQEEVLAGMVDEMLSRDNSEPEEGRHPLARHSVEPDPERLDRELSVMEEELEKAGPAERSRLADRLGVLSARCEWIRNEVQRRHLADRVEAIWRKCGKS